MSLLSRGMFSKTWLKLLVIIPDLRKYLSFEMKRRWIRSWIRKIIRSMQEDNKYSDEDYDDEEVETIPVIIDRSDLMNSSLRAFESIPRSDMIWKLFSVTFENEEGVDAGGITKEWYSVLIREMLKAEYALFSVTANGMAYQPNPSSAAANPLHLEYFKFLGAFIAKSILDDQAVDVHFTKSFYKHLLGMPVTFDDLESFDEEYYKGLMALLESPLNEIQMNGCYTFSTELSIFGSSEVVDLIPNGRYVEVTDDNKVDYVRLIANHRLSSSFRKQIDAFLAGFYSILPPELLTLFDASELELLICGLPEIDIEDLYSHTTYEGYRQGDKTIQNLWKVLRAFTSDERALFIQFVTGTSQVPFGGFKV